MEDIEKNHTDGDGPRAFRFPPEHPAMALWLAQPQGLLHRIHAHITQSLVHPARTVVLLPYAQLLTLARRLWAQTYTEGFSPRFETVMSGWGAGRARELWDITFDMAVDSLTARSLLQQAGVQRPDALVGPLVQAAYALAPMAAAVGPQERAQWAQTARYHAMLGTDNPALQWEALVSRVAVEWAAVSGYASDALFAPPEQHDVESLVLVQGVVTDPLLSSLQTHWQARAVTLPLLMPMPRATEMARAGAHSPVALHACADAQDEAQRTAAVALRHVQAGRYPLALVSSDRALTRRVRSMLAVAGVAMRDENGWKLSTTVAGSRLMGMLQAAAWAASTDTVLDCAKAAPAWTQEIDALEAVLRKAQVASWQRAKQLPQLEQDEPLQQMVDAIEQMRSTLAGHKTLAAWLQALRAVLEQLGWWEKWSQEAEGSALLTALRLVPQEPAQWQALQSQADWAHTRMDLAGFRQWVNQVLENTSIQNPYPEEEQVVILPMSQMLARPFAAVVLAGCDEVRLSAAPEPQGQWTAAQRVALGLPSRQALQEQQHVAWWVALQAPHCDVLWRTSDEAGETLQASALVQLLQAQVPTVWASEPRETQWVTTQAVLPPQPVGAALPVQQLSASAYADLRECPYRFFAMRQLGLQRVDELETPRGKRDFGLWLHAVLARFHAALAQQPTEDEQARRMLLDASAQATTDVMDMPAGEFLPFQTAWPRVREGYLAWLLRHESTGARFHSAETSYRQSVGPVTLVGRIDRTDMLPDGTLMVLDYKTESEDALRQRVRDPLEDTQAVFYAALLPHDTVQAAYVHISESKEGKTWPQADVVQARDQLIEGLLHDIERIAQGHPLPALGEGSACEYCQARGLCRKDFWATA